MVKKFGISTGVHRAYVHMWLYSRLSEYSCGSAHGDCASPYSIVIQCQPSLFSEFSIIRMSRLRKCGKSYCTVLAMCSYGKDVVVFTMTAWVEFLCMYNNVRTCTYACRQHWCIGSVRVCMYVYIQHWCIGSVCVCMYVYIQHWCIGSVCVCSIGVLAVYVCVHLTLVMFVHTVNSH